MLRAVLWTLRQRRYASLAGAMVFLALVCIGIGTFEIHRYREKVRNNGVIVANAHAPVRPLTTSVVPLTGGGPAPSGVELRYRRVSVRGSFDRSGEKYVSDQNQGGQQGFYVLTPFRTSSGVVLVVRGFVAATDSETRPDDITAAPTGAVTLTGRLEPAQTASEQLGRLGHDEIASINPAQQSARLGAPVFVAYLTLGSGQPGTSDLDPLPGPDLSNPTGGAGELQLLSYVVQWYAFAVLALLAPVLFARTEVREARKRFLGIDPERIQFDVEHEAARAELAGAPSQSGAEVEVRRVGSLANVGDVDPVTLRRARRLADRYGRSLTFGEDADATAQAAEPHEPRRDRPARREGVIGLPRPMAMRNSSQQVHRSQDEYHANYNDYLWELALRDGEQPDVDVQLPDDLSLPDPHPIQRPAPRVIDAEPADRDRD